MFKIEYEFCSEIVWACLGIWSMLYFDYKFPFSSHIKKTQKILDNFFLLCFLFHYYLSTCLLFLFSQFEVLENIKSCLKTVSVAVI